jgi:hypothetical protein
MLARPPFAALWLSAFFACGLAGCTESDAPTVPAIPVVDKAASDSEPHPTTLPAAGGWRKYDGISFQIPDDWNETEAKMVDSKYVISTDDGDIEVTLTSMGGGIDANLSRWGQQMQQAPGDMPEESVITLDGVEAKMVDVRGVFNSRVGTQQVAKNSRLIGVALPIRPTDFYVKLNGPRDAVANYYDDFRAFLKTAQVEQ